jgi:tetratricopeptide (TPR) repeat protein
MEKALNTLERFSLYLTILLLPLVVLPIFANPFGISKVAVLSFGVSIALFFCLINTLAKGEVELTFGKFDLGLTILVLAFVGSAIYRTPNKMEAFLLPGTATTVVASFILYFLIIKEKIKKNVIIALFVSGIFVALASLLAFSGVLVKIPQLPGFIKDPGFTTFGGNLPTTIYLVTLIPLALGVLIKEKDSSIKAFAGVSLVIVLLASGLLIYNMLPGKPAAPKLPGFQTSWSITVDTLKEKPILGIGPANYLTAFNRFRPISYNQTDLWNLRFTSARNFYLTVVTETGLLGTLGLILLLISVYRVVSKKIAEKDILANYGSYLSLILLLAILVFFSGGTTITALIFILLALNTSSRKVKLNLSSVKSQSTPRVLAVVICIPLILGVISFWFFGSRALKAEATFKESLDALTQNNGTLTYDLLRQSIQANPYVDRYRSNYAQVNLALAQNLAQKDEITDQDRQTIAQLVQQAIREAKATVTLNPQRAGNWHLLARTYQAIVAFAQGADTFAVQSYTQAVTLDPINPNLRVSLGGMYYALGNYDQAIRVFESAVLSKPDLANTHYNLAAALREKGDIEGAISEMTNVLSLVEPGTQDYEIAKSELDNLENKRVSDNLEGGESLQPPQEAQETTIEPPIDLPEDSNPPGVNSEPQTSPAPTN